MTMRKTIAGLAGLVLLGGLASIASAGWGFSVGYGGYGGGYCAPRYYAPVVYSSCYTPRYYDCGPRVVYRSAPRCYSTARYYDAPRYYRGGTRVYYR